MGYDDIRELMLLPKAVKLSFLVIGVEVTLLYLLGVLLCGGG